MRIIQKLTKSPQIKTYNTKELFYGFVSIKSLTSSISSKTLLGQYGRVESDVKFNRSRAVILEPLTTKERDAYLKRTHNTFMDADNCQLVKYFKIKNSNIRYFRAPSLNNKIVACVPSLDEAINLGLNEVIIHAFPLLTRFNQDLIDHISLDQMAELEDFLNLQMCEDFSI